MSTYSLSHLSDNTLLHDLGTLVSRDRATTAALLAHLAEVDVRRLYAPAGHPSMFSWCVHELHLSEDSAYKRIRAARTARRHPEIFTALAEGRLHLCTVVLLTPFLTPKNAEDLLAAAAGKSKAETEQLLALRFPRPDLPARVEPVPAQEHTGQLAPGPVEVRTPEPVGAATEQLAPGPVAAPQSRVMPLSPQRFALQATIGEGTHDKLRYIQALLGHSVPSGDVAEVLDRAFDALIGQLEKRKFAAARKPRGGQGLSSTSPRHVPADVKRAVWQRDQGQCTFVSQAGRRCPSRTRLEYDHVDPVARGGRATAGSIRLRCRAHNQYEAECAFGAAFMSQKREIARATATESRARRTAKARDRAQAEQARANEVIPWLRALGFRANEARAAAALCEPIPDAPLEKRVKVALSHFTKPSYGGAVRGLPMAP